MTTAATTTTFFFKFGKIEPASDDEQGGQNWTPIEGQVSTPIDTPQGPNKGRAQRLSTRKQTDPVFKRHQLVREALSAHADLRPYLDFHRDARRLTDSY
jgi:hypothetical protein